MYVPTGALKPQKGLRAGLCPTLHKHFKHKKYHK
jgi:hypothetical protein